MPNGTAGTDFGQGWVPVNVSWKKYGQKRQRQKLHLSIGARKTAIPRPISNAKNTKNTFADA